MKKPVALALSCHPVPTLAVTALTGGLAALAHVAAGRALLLVAAMLCCQLSIGWSNDARDAARDTAVGRRDKPVAAGAVSVRTVWTAAGVAVVAALALAATLGRAELLLMTVGIGCGWAYNLGVKATVLSPLPYAVAFASMPAAAAAARSDPAAPAVWAVCAGALFGLAAHLTNVLPDVLDDEATGVRGLPHVLGARTSAVVGPVLLAAASAVILLGGGDAGAAGVTGLVVAVAVAAWAVVRGARQPGSRLYFLAVIAVVALDLGFFALSGSALVS